MQDFNVSKWIWYFLRHPFLDNQIFCQYNGLFDFVPVITETERCWIKKWGSLQGRRHGVMTQGEWMNEPRFSDLCLRLLIGREL